MKNIVYYFRTTIDANAKVSQYIQRRRVKSNTQMMQVE